MKCVIELSKEEVLNRLLSHQEIGEILLDKDSNISIEAVMDDGCFVGIRLTKSKHE